MKWRPNKMIHFIYSDFFSNNEMCWGTPLLICLFLWLRLSLIFAILRLERCDQCLHTNLGEEGDDTAQNQSSFSAIPLLSPECWNLLNPWWITLSLGCCAQYCPVNSECCVNLYPGNPGSSAEIIYWTASNNKKTLARSLVPLWIIPLLLCHHFWCCSPPGGTAGTTERKLKREDKPQRAVHNPDALMKQKSSVFKRKMLFIRLYRTEFC